MSNSDQLRLNRALMAFEWLPFERWIPEQLFNFYHLPGGQMCKICDDVVSVTNQDDHCKMHIRQEKERRKEEKKQDGVTPRERRRLDTSGLLNYLVEHPKGETVAGISTATKKNVNDVYKEIKILLGQNKVQVVGENRIPGKRGKAAKIYGLKEA